MGPVKRAAAKGEHARAGDPLAPFAAPVRAWFQATFPEPTIAQSKGWPVITTGASTLLLAPTGSGKTLAAFLWALDRLMFGPERPGIGVVYVSPLKALAVDVERNLRAPLIGIAAAAERMGVPARVPSVAVRSGDTSARDRAILSKRGADILITTPESLYLLLTSEARRHFSTVDTLIVDEIHAIAGTKRGSHLWLSLERLEEERKSDARPLARIGLSATQRPLELVARTLAGFSAPGVPRPIEIVDAGTRRPVDVTVEVPVDDLRTVGERDAPGGAEPVDPAKRSIWPSIYPRLVELIREHKTTLVFVNNRRLAERLASALNEHAGDEIALAHHGSIAHDKRTVIEDRLKAGSIPAIVATSSLELGIDMGAVDLVIQVESPPSVSAGLQRVGRAGHRASAVSKGVIVPKFRGDLLAAAATAGAMRRAEVEATHVPEHPLDVLAQQIVAIVATDPVNEAHLYDVVRRAGPYANLPRSAYEGVLDMLSGRYPSDEFAELRPRIVWDRLTGTLSPRHGARRLAILSGGTIPDRGLYGVFLAGTEEGRPVRVGELDEEMVFESRVGEVFLLGASSWRIAEITHDRVLVVPAPGEPGKMPFWRGDKPGRPLELGLRIGELTRKLAALSLADATRVLHADHALDAKAAKNLAAYAHDQKQATGEVPSDEVIVLERFRDELGDQRVCLLSPVGSRVLAPWAMAVLTRLRDDHGLDVDAIWSDDGVVFRVADVDAAPELDLYLPDPEEVEGLILRGLDQTALFAARFRENSARALLLPRKLPGKRSPLWAQRKRSADLLSVASKFGSFPMVLETYRECLRDALDLSGLVDLLARVRDRRVRVVRVDTRTPSPFASSLLFSYVASFMYDGDAPLAERRAQALSLDQDRLRELLGEVELRELLDERAITEAAAELQHLGRRLARHADGIHDLLLSLGDLTRDEIALRSLPDLDVDAALAALVEARRLVPLAIAGQARFVAVEEVARYRDALGASPPAGLPTSLLGPVPDAIVGLASRYARTHGPFTVAELAARYGTSEKAARDAVMALVASGRIVLGSFSPARACEELCDAEVLRLLKQKSLAKLRREVEPVPQAALSRFLGKWHELERPRIGHEGLLTAIEQLEGLALPITAWLEEVLPARVRGFSPSDLDDLTAAGEVLWCCQGSIADYDARVSLHLTDRFGLLAPAVVPPSGALEQRVLEVLSQRGAMFFSDLVSALGGFQGDLLEGLWGLVLSGLVTNDTTLPLRSRFKIGDASGGRTARFRTRRALPPGSQGRWSVLPTVRANETERRAALATILLERWGVVTREVVEAEGVAGGFSYVYPVLRAMEDAGRVRRGYFVAGLGAAQFSRPGVEERLRAVRDEPDEGPSMVLAATDPANPYGAALGWPEGHARLARAPGASVVLHRGELLGYLSRGGETLVTFAPGDAAARAARFTVLAEALAVDARGARGVRHLTRVDGVDASRSPAAPHLVEAGFVASGASLTLRREGSFSRRRR